jgi:hypothetical protein
VLASMSKGRRAPASRSEVVMTSMSKGRRGAPTSRSEVGRTSEKGHHHRRGTK